MGTRTYMNVSEDAGTLRSMVRPLSGAKAGRKSIRLQIDLPLLVIAFTLLIFGMVMVYSASADVSYSIFGNPTQIFKRQLTFMAVGVVAAFILTLFDYHVWQKLAVPTILATVLALIAVLVVGDERHGAVRTLFNGSVQPSELAKLMIVIYLSVWLCSKQQRINDIGIGLIPMGGILGIVGGFIILEPDLSAVITIGLLGICLFFLAGGDLKHMAIMLLVGLIAGWIVVQFSATGAKRIADFLAGLQDPLKASYHVQRSLMAFVNGGWIGVGIGNSQTKVTGLPWPHTDSIFAVVGEETGILGASGLVVLYALLLWRGLTIAQRAPDALGRLLASGLTLWIVTEAYINMAVMVGLMPFAGNALPFISAGGSNLVISMIAIGILLGISRLSEQTKEIEERTYSEIVDLRGRDRRRRLPRTQRSTSVNNRQRTTDGGS